MSREERPAKAGETPEIRARRPAPTLRETLTIQCRFHVDTRSRGRKQFQSGEPPRPACVPGRVPRVAKLLALAHRFEGLLREGAVENYAALARLGQVTPARISQILDCAS